MNIRDKAREEIAAVLGFDSGPVTDAAELTSLVNSSFKLVELVIELQEEFDVRFHQEDIGAVSTVGQMLDLVESRSKEAAI